MHHYVFTLWALPTPHTAIAADAPADQVEALLSRLAIGHASLTGVASR